MGFATSMSPAEKTHAKPDTIAPTGGVEELHWPVDQIDQRTDDADPVLGSRALRLAAGAGVKANVAAAASAISADRVEA